MRKGLRRKGPAKPPKTLDEVSASLPEFLLDFDKNPAEGDVGRLRSGAERVRLHAGNVLGREADSSDANRILKDHGADVSSWFAASFGWEPSERVFFTTADRLCSVCGLVKSGASAFSGPVYPAADDPRNACDQCVDEKGGNK